MRKAFRTVSIQPASYLPRSNPSTLLKGAWQRNDKQGNVVQFVNGILGGERARIQISDFCWSYQRDHKAQQGVCSVSAAQDAASISEEQCRSSAQGAATDPGHVPSFAASLFPDLGQVSSVPPGAIVHRS